MRRALVLAGLVAAVVVVPAGEASAHPLGNFTVSQYSGLVVRPSAVVVDLVVDMAEIPAFQTRSEIDADGDRQVDPAERSAYLGRACDDLVAGLDLRLDGQPLDLRVRGRDLSFPPGQAGLVTLRLGCELGARTDGAGGERRITFSNRNFADRLGWRETTAAGDGVAVVASDVPSRSVSGRLTRYPDDLLQSPLDQRGASLRVRPGGAGPAGEASGRVDVPASPLGRRADRVTEAFTALVARQDLNLGFGLFALAAAVLLGALHALAPGHGKTVMAAYLVGQRGSLRQAALVGLTVTATHTAGVLVLGVLLSGSATLVPERLYPWLRVASGSLLAAVGAGLLARALGRRRRRPADHDPGHGPPHGHHHHDHHDHDHGHHHHHPAPGEGVSRRALVAMGAAGGMVPSPSALVVLLGAIALGRTWFGIALVLGYGVGMALSLLGAGLLLVRFRGALDGRLQGGGGRWPAVLGRILPVATATLVVVAGLGIAAQAAVQV
jgi:ABC-type nickel/cobalt efflux system permease component RcnA